MRIKARYNETVCGLLFRVFGDDSDELEADFYRLNPTQKSQFLAPKQVVIVPDKVEVEKQAVTLKPLEVWE
ncbi:hypothetical protein [Vibrio harveyi]|uniref:hypothetical protein n=1 Tax=Vibrio harveyi TaxID=669 RepID=UPI00034DA092|nr:hypothetical protein [Vibrio harveyi]GEA22304.1 hypothetical protein VH1807_contig00024-0022 [Vibrio harveyi]HDM8166657.1 hypothetical protein [Vibrio harveyi]